MATVSCSSGTPVQGYLADKKLPRPLARTTVGPCNADTVLLWGPRRLQFLMREVPMYSTRDATDPDRTDHVFSVHDRRCTVDLVWRADTCSIGPCGTGVPRSQETAPPIGPP